MTVVESKSHCIGLFVQVGDSFLFSVVPVPAHEFMSTLVCRVPVGEHVQTQLFSIFGHNSYAYTFRTQNPEGHSIFWNQTLSHPDFWDTITLFAPLCPLEASPEAMSVPYKPALWVRKDEVLLLNTFV